MNKTVGVLAHVDAGKTTFSEQLLFHTNVIGECGRVDHKNTCLDTHEIEKERGITVFSDQAVFAYKGDTYYLLDTPGHVDFSGEMERSIRAMDYAIIIVSAVEGVRGHTHTVYNLLKEHNVPTFFFINKIDRVGADIQSVLQTISRDMTPNIYRVDETYLENHLTEKFVEFIAEQDEELLECYMEGEIDEALWQTKEKELIKNRVIFPCFVGSALQDEGIIYFLEQFHRLTYTAYQQDKAFSGRVYKIRHDLNGQKVAYIKILSGKIKIREPLTYCVESKSYTDKVTSIRSYTGTKYTNQSEAGAGELVGVTGLREIQVGTGIGETKEDRAYKLVPTLRSKVIFDDKLNPKDVYRDIKLLGEEDPNLQVNWEEESQSIHISVMGKIQLEILEEVIRERFQIDVSFGTCEILYRETIINEAIGSGHFEPLKHYAEVHLKLEPAKRGEGIVFKNKCHTDHLTVGNQNLVKEHLFEKPHRGILTGSPLTDIKVTLLTGRAHNKHTSGGDFREATYRALRQGLDEANNILLEPYYDFRIEVHTDYMGRVLTDINRLKGEFETPEMRESQVIITGRGPVATFMEYSVELMAFTKGEGVAQFTFGGYDRCHNEEAVIVQRGYDKTKDPHYTSDSIFCKKGEGFVVKSEEAKKYMHCEL